MCVAGETGGCVGVIWALEAVGRQVFKSQMTDDEAAKILAAIAEEEDLNGRIRRNVLDTRRALSFLWRLAFLETPFSFLSPALLRSFFLFGFSLPLALLLLFLLGLELLLSPESEALDFLTPP